MNNHSVTLDQLAERLGVSRMTAHRAARRYGVLPKRQQIAGANHRQRVLVWSETDAAKIIQRRRDDGFLVREPEHA